MVTLDQGGRARESVELVAPPLELAHLVEYGSIHRYASHHPTDRQWRIVPDASANLIFTLTDSPDGRRGRAVVVGARTIFEDIDVSRRCLTVSVRLRPGALSRLAREHAGRFTDRSVPLADVFGAHAADLADRIGEAAPRAGLDLFFDWLRAAGGTARGIDAIVAAAGHAASVAGLARTAGLAVRTLHVRVHETIGIGPKRLLRIARLYRAMDAASGHVGWAGIAASSGFADQPHLVREFRALVGEPPEAWMARGRDADSFKTARSRRR